MTDLRTAADERAEEARVAEAALMRRRRSAGPRARRGHRRRVYAALGLLLVAVGMAGLVKVGLDRRADHAAAVAAATEAAQRAIERQIRAYVRPAVSGSEAAEELRVTLQEHLTISARSDEQLAEDRREHQSALAYASRDLNALAEAPPPVVPDEADADAVTAHLALLQRVRARAPAIADRFLAGAHGSQRWTSALLVMREQHQRYVDTVEAQPESHDPEELQALWESERAVLAEYRAAVEAAAEVEGLDLLAGAYLAYVEANLAWVDEAVGLLADGDIDAYNARLAELFAVPDPFGFRSAVADATTRSLEAGVIVELAESADEARAFLEIARADVQTEQPNAPSPPEVPGAS